MIRTVLGFVVAVAVALVAGAAGLSWFDQASYLEAAGATASLSVGERLSWFVGTLTGLTVGVGFYPILLAAGLAIALVAAALVQRLAPGLRTWWYGGAGAVALIVMVLTLKAVMGLKVLPGARTEAGMIAQGVAGLLAGLAFALLTRRRAQG